MHGEVSTPLKMLFAITGVVLLIACANIANLLLAQGANRSQEMAVRGSLGASRFQLMSQLLIDSCVLALLGGIASLVVALCGRCLGRNGVPIRHVPGATQHTS